MKVNVGSENPVKVKAVKNAFGKYFKEVKINSAKTKSEVRDQPLNLLEILNGAKIRAQKNFSDCDYSIGIESGIMSFPCDSGYMEITVAAIFDGKKFFIGTSPLFEYPKKAVKLLLQERDNITSAFVKLFGKQKDLGRKQGAVGELTKGKVNRAQFTEMAVLMALMKIVSKEFFE